jgi:hypothetical protein
VPSIAAQTVKSFRWVLLIDGDSPEWFEQRLAEAAEASGVPVSIARISGYLGEENLRAAVAQYATSAHLITTRIDNDDVAACDLIESVQARFEPRPLVIDFPDGAQYQGGAFYRIHYALNAFISYVEPSEDAVTVLRDQHPLMGKYAPVVTVRTRHAMWVQNVHGGNVANSVSGWRVSPEGERRWFPSLDLPSVTLTTVVFSRVAVAVRRVASLFRRVLRKARRR